MKNSDYSKSEFIWKQLYKKQWLRVKEDKNLNN